MRMCEECLKSDPNFSKAREALYKLKDSSHQSSEWYSWWFSHVKGKKALGVLLISSILAPLHNLSVLVTAVITMMGLSIAVLLLPSLTKIKVGSIVELETVPIIYTETELEAFSAIPTLISVSMPTEIPLQHFRMPLQNLQMPNKFPLKSVYMPLQRHGHR